jgi:hypothetical protein
MLQNRKGHKQKQNERCNLGEKKKMARIFLIKSKVTFMGSTECVTQVGAWVTT